MIDDRRNPVVRADREKFRFELIAGPDVDGNDVVGNAEFFQHDRDFPAVRRRRVMKVDHGIILMEAAAILARDAIAFQRCCGLVGRMADMAHKRSTRNDREAQMLFPTTIAGSLPKPEWLAEPNTLWAPWKSSGAELARAKRDATMLAIKLQEDAGVDIVTARKLKFTLPGPMTIIDTIADQYYGDRVKMAFAFAELLNEEAKALQADGIDVIQFDEPAFNVYMDEVGDWGIRALERAAEGLTCATAVHICYGYGIKANTDWKQTLGSEWRQYEEIFPAIANSPIQQVAIECRNSHVPLELLGLLTGKVVQAGVIDVASDAVETAEDVAEVIDAVSKFVPKSNIVATTNCGMAPMHRDIAEAKLMALGAGAKLARERFG